MSAGTSSDGLPDLSEDEIDQFISWRERSELLGSSEVEDLEDEHPSKR